MNINNLSQPLLSNIFLNLHSNELMTASVVSKKWLDACNADYIWRKLCFFPSCLYMTRDNLLWKNEWALAQKWKKGIYHLRIEETPKQSFKTRIVNGEIFKIKIIHNHKIEIEDSLLKTWVYLEYEEQLADRPFTANKDTFFIRTNTSLCLFNRKTGGLKLALKIELNPTLKLGEEFDFTLTCNTHYVAFLKNKKSCVVYQISPFGFFNFTTTPIPIPEYNSEITYVQFIDNCLVIGEKFGHIYLLNLDKGETEQATIKPCATKESNSLAFGQNKLAYLSVDQQNIIINHLSNDHLENLELKIVEKLEDNPLYAKLTPRIGIKDNLLIVIIPFKAKHQEASSHYFNLLKICNISEKNPKFLFVKKIEDFLISSFSINEDRIVAKWIKDNQKEGLAIFDFLLNLKKNVKPKKKVEPSHVNNPKENLSKKENDSKYKKEEIKVPVDTSKTNEEKEVKKREKNLRILFLKKIFYLAKMILFTVSKIFRICASFGFVLFKRTITRIRIHSTI